MTIFTEEVIDQINEFIQEEVLKIDSYDVRKAPRFVELTSDDSITQIEIVDELDQLDSEVVTNRMIELLDDCVIDHTFEMHLHILIQVRSDELQIEAWLTNEIKSGSKTDMMVIIDYDYSEPDDFLIHEYYEEEHGDYDELLEAYKEQLREMYPSAEDIDFSHTRKTHVIKL